MYQNRLQRCTCHPVLQQLIALGLLPFTHMGLQTHEGEVMLGSSGAG